MDICEASAPARTNLPGKLLMRLKCALTAFRVWSRMRDQLAIWVHSKAISLRVTGFTRRPAVILKAEVQLYKNSILVRWVSQLLVYYVYSSL